MDQGAPYERMKQLGNLKVEVSSNQRNPLSVPWYLTELVKQNTSHLPLPLITCSRLVIGRNGSSHGKEGGKEKKQGHEAETYSIQIEIDPKEGEWQERSRTWNLK